MRRTVKHVVMCAAAGAACLAAPACAPGNGGWPGTVHDFHGYAEYRFDLNGAACRVAVPRAVAAGRPWVWRARFYGVYPAVDIALLEKGYHIAHIDIAGLFGAPAAVARWDAFYELLTGMHTLHPRPAIEALSRGGLIAYNWAVANPARVSCIYADAPVCDIRSWPAGLWRGAGAAEELEQCLQAYGLTAAQLAAYEGTPLNGLGPLAAAGVPVLHVVGDRDSLVPVVENTAVLEERYRALGGSITVIHKPDAGHHPHGLEDCAPVVDFITGSVR